MVVLKFFFIVPFYFNNYYLLLSHSSKYFEKQIKLRITSHAENDMLIFSCGYILLL